MQGGLTVSDTKIGRIVDVRGEGMVAVLDSSEQGETPKVTVEMSIIEEKARIVVSDDGPGVPDDIRDKMFDRGTTTKEGGGLGLHLSKKIVEAIGGLIELMPKKKGVGAQFEILLPISN